MNDFEELLCELQPAMGKSDPMQIMFQAGQRSTSRAPAGRAGGWKIATGVLALACSILTAGLLNRHRPAATQAVTQNPSFNTPQELEAAASSPHLSKEPLHIPGQDREITLEDPESWKPLGPHRRQLAEIFSEKAPSGEPVFASERFTPYTFRRQLERYPF